MILIPVVFKGARHKTTPKYAGGVLNPQARYYVDRVEGNTNPMPKLIEMRNNLMEKHNERS